MYVCACRHRRKEELGQAKGKCVTHGVDEYVGNKEGEGIESENQRAKRLTEEGETGVGSCKDVAARGQIEEVDSWRVEGNVETALQINLVSRLPF